MSESAVLLLSDVVDSTQLTEQLSLDALTALWTAHDRAARALLLEWRGREIDKSDGFLLTFETVADAVGFARAYHRALQTLPQPLITRVGIHVGEVALRRNPEQEVALGAKQIEVEGAAKPLAARVMGLARGGQTLLSPPARVALGEAPAWRVQSHGHWRLKGLEAPIELFEVGDADQASFLPPPDAPKAYRVVRQGELWLPVREVRHTLPAERDSFVGREPALQELARHFDQGARLVSLLGIGGTGKTRVAQRFGWTWLGDFPGGVWFCDLSQATSADGIVHAVAQGLELPLGKTDPVEQIGLAINGRGPCLVILDNYEQVARHAEATLGRWLDKAREARFLVTTREVLGIVGEQAMALAPLAVDDGVALFVRRAVAASPGFAPQGEDQAALAPLVKLLDGLPLAIELCAARVRVMPPRMLLQRMGERFKLLTSRGGRRDRQATMKATLDWSWDLLSEVERSALAQLSVFEGGFTLEAAEAVVDLAVLDTHAWLVDVVQGLAQKSLLRTLGAERWGLLQTVQEYAAARAERVEEAWRRHWLYFASLEEDSAVSHRCAEADNLVVAARRALAADSAIGVVGRLLMNCGAALRRAGPFGVAVDLGMQALARGSCAAPDLAAAHAVAGSALFQLGRTEEARSLLEAGLKVDGPDPNTLSALLCTLGELLASTGSHSEAQAVLERALALAASTSRQCRVLNAMGGNAHDRGQLEVARSWYERALRIAQANGHSHWEGGILGNLGLLSHVCGDLEEATLQYQQSLSIATEIGDRRWEGNSLCNLGLLLLEKGMLDDALAALSKALLHARHLGHARLEATALCNIGLIEQARKSLSRAEDLFRMAVKVAEQAEDSRLQGQFLGHLGRCLSLRSELGRAREAFARGIELLSSVGDSLSLAQLQCWFAICEASTGNLGRARALQSEALKLVKSESLQGSLALRVSLDELAQLLFGQEFTIDDEKINLGLL